MSFNHKNKQQAPTVMLLCGLAGSGKTTLAHKLAIERQAVRLCPDEWMADLGIDLFDGDFRTKLEARLWEFGKEQLKFGHDVIVEYGSWAREERDLIRTEAAKLGARTELHYLATPLDEIARRVAIRNTTAKHGTASLTPEHLEAYAKSFQAPGKPEMKLYEGVIIYRS